MKTLLKFALLTASFCIATSLSFAEGEWLNDYAKAKQQAADQKKDLFLFFTGSDWCGWCKKLKSEVLDQEAFLKDAKEKFILMDIDFPRNTQQSDELKKQNEELSTRFPTQGYPTVVLCDATERPYAQTGYEAGGAEAYIKHLDGLRAVKTKRDEAFATAEKEQDPEKKAAALIAALKTMDEAIINQYYSTTIDEIAKLDPEDKLHFAKDRKEKIAKEKAAEDSQNDVRTFFVEKISPLMKNKEFAEATKLATEFLKEHPSLPDKIKTGILLNVQLAEPMTKGDKEASFAVIEKIAKEYPDSEIAKNVDKIKPALEQQLARMKEAANKTPEEKKDSVPAKPLQPQGKE